MITDQLRTPNGVEAGSKATFDLDLGNLYRELWLRVSCAAGDTVYNGIVDDITLEVNGKPQRIHTAEELNGINILHDADLAVKTTGSIEDGNLVSFIPIFLAEDFRKNVDRGLALGWNAIGIRSLQLKVQLKSGAASPSLSGWGVWDRADTGRALGVNPGDATGRKRRVATTQNSLKHRAMSPTRPQPIQRTMFVIFNLNFRRTLSIRAVSGLQVIIDKVCR